MDKDVIQKKIEANNKNSQLSTEKELNNNKQSSNDIPLY